MASKHKVLSQLADEILAEATADEARSKEAAAVVKVPKYKTAVGGELAKMASELRGFKADVTYADIQEFRKRYGI